MIHAVRTSCTYDCTGIRLCYSRTHESTNVFPGAWNTYLCVIFVSLKTLWDTGGYFGISPTVAPPITKTKKDAKVPTFVSTGWIKTS